MRQVVKFATITLMGLSLGCTTTDTGPKETAGAITGAVIGGVIGDQFGSGDGNTLATGAGILIGVLVGSEIGRQLDDADRMRANRAVRRAYTTPLGETVYWSNPNSGNSGTVVALREGTSTSGRYCREFRQTIIIGGRAEQGIGTACRLPDGSWQITG